MEREQELGLLCRLALHGWQYHGERGLVRECLECVANSVMETFLICQMRFGARFQVSGAIVFCWKVGRGNTKRRLGNKR